MDQTAVVTTFGMAPEVAQGVSLLMFVLAAFLFLLVALFYVRRKAKGQTALPGAAIALLIIGIASFTFALILKVF